MNERRILVVDDENSLRKVLSDLLRLRGYDPIAVGSGEEALDELGRSDCAVAIIDLALHEGGGSMDGMELLHRVRKHHEGTECVVLTGAPSQESVSEAISAGAFSYLMKPFNVTELIGTLERAIERRQEHQALAGAEHDIQEASQRHKHVVGTLRSECVSRLDTIVRLAQSVSAAESLGDARRFALQIEKDVRQVLTTVDALLDEANGGAGKP